MLHVEIGRTHLKDHLEGNGFNIYVFQEKKLKINKLCIHTFPEYVCREGLETIKIPWNTKC